MAVKDVSELGPGDTIRYRGQSQTVEAITPDNHGYYIYLEQFPIHFRFGTQLLVVDETDAVSEAERIIDEARQ